MDDSEQAEQGWAQQRRAAEFVKGATETSETHYREGPKVQVQPSVQLLLTQILGILIEIRDLLRGDEVAEAELVDG